jgi:hypothetical protein
MGSWKLFTWAGLLISVSKENRNTGVSQCTQHLYCILAKDVQPASNQGETEHVILQVNRPKLAKVSVVIKRKMQGAVSKIQPNVILKTFGENVNIIRYY